MNPVRRLSRIDLISADPTPLAAFYGALGFAGVRSAPPAVGEDRRIALRLGEQRIDLIRPSHLGSHYPASVPGWSLWFQHIAIVVADMHKAYARLQTLVGWTAISTEGPQRLPEASGGVTAFKFRDPEGHPLEFIEFPTGHTPDAWRLTARANLFLGIDHSAVSVTDSARSGIFYGQLGLSRTSGSINVGIEQARLDDVADAHVEVTGLSPADPSTPHVELLSYRGEFLRDVRPLSPNDIAASRLVFETRAARLVSSSMTRDPDGHLIVFDETDAYANWT
jgi:catechol 2,3-dioxygenase-like lactoylglutathione lyase family enzyme